MELKCPTCKLDIKTPETVRCPRCHTILMKVSKCVDCKGCSILKLCKK